MLSTLDFQYMCRCQHMFLIPCQFCSHSKKSPMLDKYSLSQISAFPLFQRKSTLLGSDLISLWTQQGLAGNEKWRKGWLTLTLPICTFQPLPPPLSIDLSVQNIFQSDLAGFSFLDGWTWKRGIYLVWNPSTEVVFWIVRGERKSAHSSECPNSG